MPEVILCRHCKQPINKETDQYVIEKATDRQPETLAHVACEQKSPKSPTAFRFDEWIRKFQWPSRSVATTGFVARVSQKTSRTLRIRVP